MVDPDHVTEALAQARRIIAGRFRQWSPEDRKDLVSIVMVRYVQHFPQGGHGPDNPRAWLRTVANNAAKDYYEKVERKVQALDGDVERDRPGLNLWLAGVFSQSPSVLPARMDLQERVLKRLTPDDRALFIDKHIWGRPSKDLAAERGITVAAVDKRLSRVRAALRDQLTRDPGLLDELHAGMPQLHQHRPRPTRRTVGPQSGTD